MAFKSHYCSQELNNQSLPWVRLHVAHSHPTRNAHCVMAASASCQIEVRVGSRQTLASNWTSSRWLECGDEGREPIENAKTYLLVFCLAGSGLLCALESLLILSDAFGDYEQSI